MTDDDYDKEKNGEFKRAFREGKAVIAYLLVGVNVQLFILIKVLSNVAG
jgi:hypothetical protein